MLKQENKIFKNLYNDFGWEIDNALKRIDLLNDSDKKSVLEEYKEWIKDGLSNHTVLLLRDDPII